MDLQCRWREIRLFIFDFLNDLPGILKLSMHNHLLIDVYDHWCFYSDLHCIKSVDSFEPLICYWLPRTEVHVFWFCLSLSELYHSYCCCGFTSSLEGWWLTKKNSHVNSAYNQLRGEKKKNKRYVMYLSY